MQVAWLKENHEDVPYITISDLHDVLTINQRIVSRNPRLRVTLDDRGQAQLTISDVRQTDQGWYRCEIGTDPVKFSSAYLRVKGWQDLWLLKPTTLYQGTCFCLAVPSTFDYTRSTNNVTETTSVVPNENFSTISDTSSQVSVLLQQNNVMPFPSACNKLLMTITVLYHLTNRVRL